MKKILLLATLTITAMQSHASTGTSKPTLEQLLSSTLATISIECLKISDAANSKDWQNIVVAVNNLIEILATPNSSENTVEKVVQSIRDIADIIQDIQSLNSTSGIQTSVTASIGTPATAPSQTGSL